MTGVTTLVAPPLLRVMFRDEIMAEAAFTSPEEKTAV
jgi:hypothetical protein